MRRLLLLVVALGACAPTVLPVEVAERQCADEVTRPRGGTTTTGGIGIGFGGGGTSTSVGLGVSTDLSRPPADPEAAFAACVQRRSGQPPTRPLFDRG